MGESEEERNEKAEMGDGSETMADEATDSSNSRPRECFPLACKLSSRDSKE